MANFGGIEVRPGDILNTYLGLQTGQDYRFVYDPRGKYEITFRGENVSVQLQRRIEVGNYRDYENADLFKEEAI